jgi:cation:H+ antiporter
MSNDFIFSGNENILSMVDGIILLALFILFLYYIYRMIKKDQAYAQKYGADKYGADVRKLSSFKIYAWVLLGIAALYFGGELTVNTAVIIAKNLGVSDFLISITIIAVGTSLPELFTTIVAVTRKEVDIGVGTLVGSNIFNIFLILGVTALINPVAVPSSANLHILILIAITVLLFAFMFIGERHILKKWQGRTMVLLYLVYIYLIITGVLPA